MTRTEGWKAARAAATPLATSQNFGLAALVTTVTALSLSQVSQIIGIYKQVVSIIPGRSLQTLPAPQDPSKIATVDVAARPTTTPIQQFEMVGLSVALAAMAGSRLPVESFFRNVVTPVLRVTIGLNGGRHTFAYFHALTIIQSFMQKNRTPQAVAFLTMLVARRVIGKLLQSLKTPIGAELTTRFIKKTLQADNLSSSQQRQVFIDAPLISSTPSANHTHGASAQSRNAGSHTAAMVARLLGKEPYYFQMSLADLRKGRDGDRTFHWAKDLAIPPQAFHFQPQDQVGVLVDVDHYFDMPRLLAEYPGTYLISTAQPTAAAGSSGEYSFMFSDNRIKYVISGGAEFDHQVWDYSGDTILVESVGWFYKTIVSYHIDRKYLDEHHALILLSLIGKFEVPVLLPSSWVIEGRGLKRLEPCFGDYTVMDIQRPDGMYRSVALKGTYLAATYPRSTFDAVHAAALQARVLTPALVATNAAVSSPIGLPTEKLPPGHAALLTGYLKAGLPKFTPIVFPPSESMLPIYFGKHDYNAQPALVGFGSPLIGPSYGFVTSIASDDRCIAGRVEKFQAKMAFEKPMPTGYAGYIDEFSKLLIPIPHTGVPVDHDYVFEKQNRPSQRSILQEAAASGPFYKTSVKAFNKKETYQKPTDPRNISQVSGPVKLEYSTFLYAFHNQVMMGEDWYAFSKTPVEIASRVCKVLHNSTHSVMADGSRWDGHVNRRMRILERTILLRHFQRGYHADLNEAMDKQIGRPATTTEGRTYNTGYSRLSGSLETSDFNTLGAAFIDYCAWRNTVINGAKCTPEQAYRLLGVYGGDDSLAGAVDPVALQKAATVMGQDYEITVVNRYELGVNFLNRQFGPHVWTGDPSSMANPARALGKLFVGPRVLYHPLVRFSERASGYYRMDANSPVLGKICEVAHILLGEAEHTEFAPWYGQEPVDTNWPNEDSGWMMDVFNKSIPDFDFDRFDAWINEILASGDPALLLQAPLCTAVPQELAPVKQACVVGEDLRYPEKEPEKPADTAVSASGPEVDLDDNTETAPLGDDTQEEVPVAVAQAAEVVPVVDAAGKTIRKPSAPKAPKKRAQTCGHPQVKGKDCPCSWREPKAKDGETAPEFASRLQAWTRTRKSVAKKLGVALPRK